MNKNKKKWYLRNEYDRKDYNNILHRVKGLLFKISLDNDVSIKTYKRIDKIGNILLELQYTEIKSN